MPETTVKISPETANRLRRYQKTAALLQKWMAEANDYDETTWPALEQELKDSAMRCQETDGRLRREFFTV